MVLFRAYQSKLETDEFEQGRGKVDSNPWQNEKSASEIFPQSKNFLEKILLLFVGGFLASKAYNLPNRHYSLVQDQQWKHQNNCVKSVQKLIVRDSRLIVLDFQQDCG